MEKAMAEPSRAMTVSNPGTTMARMVMTTSVPVRRQMRIRGLVYWRHHSFGDFSSSAGDEEGVAALAAGLSSSLDGGSEREMPVDGESPHSASQTM